MKIKPLKDRVVLEQLQKETTTVSGIVLAAPDREAQTEAIVIAIGPDVEEVVVGDKVLVDWSRAGKAGEYYVIKEEFIVAVVGE